MQKAFIQRVWACACWEQHPVCRNSYTAHIWKTFLLLALFWALWGPGPIQKRQFGRHAKTNHENGSNPIILLKWHVRREKGPTRGPGGPTVVGWGALVVSIGRRSALCHTGEKLMGWTIWHRQRTGTSPRCVHRHFFCFQHYSFFVGQGALCEKVHGVLCTWIMLQSFGTDIVGWGAVVSEHPKQIVPLQ